MQNVHLQDILLQDFLPQAGLPRRAGVGFKPMHFEPLASKDMDVGFIEIHAENYMGAGGIPHAQLAKLRETYALSIHGVGLSLGGEQRPDAAHLARLKKLCARYAPEAFSEHLAWSSHQGVFFNDLLPLPYTEETLARVAAHIDEVQSVLQRPMLLENPATYLRFDESAISEAAFIEEIVRRTGCGLLLDINNLFVSARNHGRDVLVDLAAFPLPYVKEIHLAAHTATPGPESAPLLIDSHGAPVANVVLDLCATAIAIAGPLPVLIEWDNDVPAWQVLRRQVMAAQAILDAFAFFDAA
jgi:uncharacterized protein (UPF0276 family)